MQPKIKLTNLKNTSHDAHFTNENTKAQICSRTDKAIYAADGERSLGLIQALPPLGLVTLDTSLSLISEVG